MRTVRLSHIAATAGAMMSLIGLILSACVPAQQYDALENDYNQLNQRLSSEIGGAAGAHHAVAGRDQSRREQ